MYAIRPPARPYLDSAYSSAGAIRIASPFAGRMQSIAGGTTVVIYVFLIALKFLPVLMEVL